MISPAQIRAARGLLGLSQTELAALAEVGVATVRRIEGASGDPKVTVTTMMRIERALESAGVVFVEPTDNFGPGVRFRISTVSR